jgi:integrase
MTPALRQTNQPAPAAEAVAMHAGATASAKPSASELHLRETSALVPVTAAAQPEQASPGRIHRDEDGKIIPGFRLDRRSVTRKPSDLPRLSEVAEEYFAAREVKLGEGHKDIQTARMRLGVFLDLIGDHPVDTYTPADLQAFIALMTHWPAQGRHRPSTKLPREILAANADLRFKPLKRSALEDGYVTTARAIIRHKMTEYEFPDPFLNAKLKYPETAAPKQSTEPLSSEQKSRIFRTGVRGGLLDEAILPLLGDLTGRRIGLLVHLQGSDIREKYPGVFVAQTSGIVLTPDGVWRRVPIKTDHSTTFFILHDFLREIGFVDWALARGETSLFSELTRLENPSKSASSYMQRLFKKAGVQGKGREVFHSLRGGHIDFLREAKVDPRDRRLQAGHQIDDEHDLYGFKVITEARAFEIAHAALDERVDYSIFPGLDFEKLAQGKRTRGRRVKG